MKQNQKIEGYTLEAYNNKMDFLELKVEQIERKLSNKADEVVNIQLLQHRRELEELYSAVSQIESHLNWIDLQLSSLVKDIPGKPLARKNTRSGKVTPLFT
jgi:hypothetical protein